MIFLWVVGIVFMALGVLGICKKVKRLKKIEGVRRVKGYLSEYTVGQMREDDGFILDLFFPVYEYKWEGERRELHSSAGVLGYQCRTRGHWVYILIDPQTGKARCMENEKPYVSILLILGVLGVLDIVLLAMFSAGFFPFCLNF